MDRHGFAVSIVASMLVGLTGCASMEQNRESWKLRDTALEISWQALNAIDGSQTANIHEHPELIETSSITRWILGEQPDPKEAYLYFLSIGVSHYFIMRALPPKWRPWFQGIWIYNSGKTVIDNHQLGLGP